MAGFATYEQSAQRVPNRGPFGTLLAGTFGGVRDDELALLRVALLSRLPARCPDDALDDVGQTMNIERYAADTNDSYRARLVAAWPTWSEAGSPQAIEDQIRAFGIPDVLVVMHFEASFSPDPRSDYAEFIIFLGPDLGSTGIVQLILGSFTLGSGVTLGSTAGIEMIRTLKRLVLKWKSAHSYPVKLIAVFGTGPLLGIGVLPNARPLILGSFTLGGDVSEIIWPIGRTLNDTLPTLGSDGFILGGYQL